MTKSINFHAIKYDHFFSLACNILLAVVLSLMLFEKSLGHSAVHYAKLGFLFLPFLHNRINKEIKIYAFLAILFVFSVALSNYLSPYSLRQHGGEGILHWALILPIALICFYSQPTLKKLFIILSIALCVALIPACYDLYTGIRSSAGFHGLAIVWGNVAIATGLLCLFIGMNAPWKYAFLQGIVCFSLALFISSVSLSRGGWVALIILSPLIGYQLFKKLPAKTLFITLLLMVLSIVFIVTSSKVGMGERFSVAANEIINYTNDVPGSADTSIGTRFEMWRSGIRAFSEHPLLGVSNTGFSQWLKHDTQYRTSFPISHPHNQFVLLLACFGITGTLIFCAMILFFLKGVFSLSRYNEDGEVIKLLAIVLLFSYMAFSLTESFFTHAKIGSGYFIYISTYLLVLAGRKSTKHAQPLMHHDIA